METIGAYLKRVRETCGYSLEHVAGITKINLRYLEAIEHDDYTKIPGDIFYMGFVRSFAKCLGISEEEISRRIRDTPKGSAQPITSQGSGDPEIERSVVKQGKKRIILPIAAGVVAAVFLLILFTGGRNNDDPIRNSREIREVPAEDISVQPEVALKKNEPVALGIRASELTWISATIDDRETKDVILKPGEGVKWNGESKIVITVGNAGGIDMDLNGRTIGPVGKRGEVVRGVVITSDGVNRPGNE